MRFIFAISVEILLTFCLSLTFLSFPTILIAFVVSFMFFINYGYWHSPVDEFMQEFFTFSLDTEMIGFNLIFNTLWDFQLCQSGRIWLSAIGLGASLLMFIIIFLLTRFSSNYSIEEFLEKRLTLIFFFTQFFFIPAWWGGFVFLFVSVVSRFD